MKSLPQPLRREGSPYWMKKPPQAPPKGGDVLFAEDLQYYLCLSSSELVGLPSFRRGRGRLLGGLPFTSFCYSVTRYTLHFCLWSFRRGGREGIVYYYI